MSNFECPIFFFFFVSKGNILDFYFQIENDLNPILE